MGRGYLSISLVWFFCLGGLGVFFPFYSLYLYENAGLSGGQVGMVVALLPLVGIAAQPFWGNVADRRGSRARVLVWLAAGASLGYCGLYFADGFAGLLIGTAALAAFSTSLIPSCVSASLAISSANPHGFGLIRVWGTVGFLICVVAFPRLLDAIQRARGIAPVPGVSEPGLEVMFLLTAGLVLLGGLFALALPREGAVSLRAPRGDWRRLARHGPFVRVVLFTLAAFLCLQGPMVLFPVYVRAHGGTLDAVSAMWVPMLLVEIPLVALSGASLARIGARGLLAAGVLAGGVRWTVCGLADDLFWIYPVQLLHGVVIAGLVLGAPLYVEAAVPARLRSTGQGVLAMVGISLGGISSNLGAGWLLDRVGPDAPYLVGGLGALVLGCLLPFLLPAARRPEGVEGEESAS